jgi:hypothetical protein
MSIPTKNINAEKIQGNLDVTSISGGTIFSGTTELTTIIENIVSGNQITGTTGSIAFFGTGNTITQDNTNFFWNNTDKRLILGTETVADTNSRLVVIGKGTGTNTTFAVHNSTGNNNALVVRDNGAIMCNTSTTNSQFEIKSLTANGSAVFTLRRNTAGLNFNQILQVYDNGQVDFWDTGVNGLFRFQRAVGNFANNINLFSPALSRGIAFLQAASDLQTGMNFYLNSTDRDFGFNFGSTANMLGMGQDLVMIDGKQNIRIGNGRGGNVVDANATRTLLIANGTAPITNITDAFQQYSADITAGNAAPHFRTENGSIIKLYREAAVTTVQGLADALTNQGLLASSTISTIDELQIALTAQVFS